jgi:hypothetical protein
MLCRLAVVAAALSAAGTAAAGEDRVSFDHCDLATGWALSLAGAELAFTRDDGVPARLALDDGRLRADGREVALSADDRRRLRDYEATVRDLLPDAKAIALEGIEIAFVAVNEVARLFLSADEAVHAATAGKIATARIVARRQVEEAFAGRDWSDAELERLVEDAVVQLMPALVGSIAASAVKAALSGDEQLAGELEARAARMEREIEARVARRAKALEARAEAFCRRLAALDRLEAEIDAEIAPGQRFDLIRVEP